MFTKNIYHLDFIHLEIYFYAHFIAKFNFLLKEGEYIISKGEEPGSSWSKIIAEFLSKITAEFLLVIIMLLTLTILVYSILSVPIQIDGRNNTDIKETLDYRRETLAIVLTAFGAWIGAGAAYFFGRENMREATESLLKFQERSSGKMLKTTYVKEVPPNTLDWTVHLSENVESVKEKLKKESGRWFIPILNNNGTLNHVIDKEVIWRFMDKKYKNNTSYQDVNKETISAVNDFIENHPGEVEGLVDIYVPVKMDTSASDAIDLMQRKNVCLGIITDEKGKPTHYITKGDTKKLLLERG